MWTHTVTALHLVTKIAHDYAAPTILLCLTESETEKQINP